MTPSMMKQIAGMGLVQPAGDVIPFASVRPIEIMKDPVTGIGHEMLVDMNTGAVVGLGPMRYPSTYAGGLARHKNKGK